MCYSSSSGIKRDRSVSSLDESIDETLSNTKKQRVVDGGDQKKGNVSFSDSKAARVETLKKRFGRIIVKATEFQVEDKRSDQYHKVDPVEMQKKNQILEKKLKEAEIAAEAALKKELQMKREAARKALLELERRTTIEIDDNLRTMKDFATLLGYPPNCAQAACVNGLCFSYTSRTSDWRKR